MAWIDLNENDERRVAAFMARVAALPSRGPSLDATQIWWKAQLLRRWDAERMAALPLDVMQPVEIAAGLVAVAFLLIRSLPYLGY